MTQLTQAEQKSQFADITAYDAAHDGEQVGTKQIRSQNLPLILKPAGRATMSAARFALFFTAVAWLVYLIEQILRLSRTDLNGYVLAETVVYLTLVTLLTLSAAAYLLSRIGYFDRINSHRRVPRSRIDNHFSEHSPSLTVLVPSYREEERIIQLTMLSAALQEFSNMRVVLLIDDPPNPADVEHRLTLERTRNLVTYLNKHLEYPRQKFENALAAFEREHNGATIADVDALQQLADCYESAAYWFEQENAHLDPIDHVDLFFKNELLGRMSQDLHSTAQALRKVCEDPEAHISWNRAHQLYMRLVNIFKVDISSFERKQFASLSHEPNKAMNLNSYLGLMGGQYNIVSSPGGQVLISADDRLPGMVVPDSDYVLTLDADSILLPEYCLRLVYFLEQEENQEIAICQTPYSAYHGPPSRIERIAGATTDIQYIAHLGMTQYLATSWVGANAVIRKKALEDLETTTEESGFVIRRYISDRTVIEDTESTIDLRGHGWRLYNYPERLSYSATPPDYGSLVIQRRRGANGGLVIWPKLLGLQWKRPEGVPRLTLGEFFLRTSYLVSISWANVSLLLLLFYPFDGFLLSRFAILTAVPYWLMMASDLRRVGYRRRDIFQVYGFNLLLLPINLAGTTRSLVQAVDGQRIAFARTPKVKDHTVAPLIYIIIPFILIGWSAWTLQNDLVEQAYIHGAFAAANLLTMVYAVLFFLGLKYIFVDIFVNIREYIYKPVSVPQSEAEIPHWASVLYVDSSVPEEIDRAAPYAVALATEDLVINHPDAVHTQRDPET